MFSVLLVFALLASAISANKIILYALAPSFLVGLRMFFGGLILFLFNYLRNKNLNINLLKQHIGTLILIAALTTFVPSFLKAYSLKYLISSQAAFFGSLDPFFTSILAYFLLGEKLNAQKILGISIAMLGTFIIIISDPACHIKNIFCISLPELAMIAAVIISRLGWIIAQKLLKKNIFSATQMNTATMLLSGIIAIMISIFFNEVHWGSLSQTPFSILNNSPFNAFSGQLNLFLFVAYTTILGTVIAYTLYANILKKYSAVFISLLSFSVPLFVHIFGWLFLSEKLSFNFFIACAITLFGFYIFSKQENKKI